MVITSWWTTASFMRICFHKLASDRAGLATKRASSVSKKHFVMRQPPCPKDEEAAMPFECRLAAASDITGYGVHLVVAPSSSRTNRLESDLIVAII
jgi:hypothetical protein